MFQNSNEISVFILPMHGIYPGSDPMHTTRSIQLPGLSLIFKKTDKGNYTKDALLYQDILHYYGEQKKKTLIIMALLNTGNLPNG